MAAGVVIKHKRKSGAFIDGDLAAGEWGLDVSGDAWYYSKNGTTVELHASGGNLSNFGSPTSGQYARFTDATHAEGVSVASVKTDLSLNNVTNESKATMFTDAALTGNPTAPTQSAGNSSTRIASTAFVAGEIASANLGIQKRTTVRAATTASITISTALNNGDVLDGVTLATNDLVLVKNQSSPEQNGVYVVGVSPARSAQYDTYDEHAGAIIVIEEGTSNADTIYFSTSNLGGTLDSTAISFTKLVIAGELLASNNLSDVANAGTARSNLGTNDAANLTTGNVPTAQMQVNVAAAINASGSAAINNSSIIIDGGTI
jgi:hypothetical protein